MLAHLINSISELARELELKDLEQNESECELNFFEWNWNLIKRN